VLADGIFLALHALVHACDMLAGRELMQNFRSDTLAIFLPALITLWLAISSAPSDGKGFKRQKKAFFCDPADFVLGSRSCTQNVVRSPE
jgi:hypothetical protein